MLPCRTPIVRSEKFEVEYFVVLNKNVDIKFSAHDAFVE